MEKKFFCGLVLPLKEIATRQVAIILWNVSISDPINKFQYRWNIIEDMVKGKVSNLKLPDSLKKPILRLLRPIGSDIFDWIYYHKDNFFDSDDIDNLFTIILKVGRTWYGTIDYRKTAENFVNLEMFRFSYNFKFACLYCVEDKIPFLWEKLPVKEQFKRDYNKSYRNPDTQMMCYWIALLREDEYKLENIIKERTSSSLPFYQHVLRISAFHGNKAATEYFSHKLSFEERDFLFEVVCDVIDNHFRRPSRPRNWRDFAPEQISAVLCYLLSIITPDQQMQVFKQYPIEILICFLDWPLQYLFLDIADLCWNFIQEHKYNLLLTKIHDSIKIAGYYSPDLIQEFLLRSPCSFRKLFVDRECRSSSFFLEFFLTQDTETVQVVLRNLDAADRVRLIFSESVFKLLNDFLLRGRWNIVEVCIREATLSKEDRGRQKVNFMEYVTRTDGGLRVKWRTHKRRRFFEFLD